MRNRWNVDQRFGEIIGGIILLMIGLLNLGDGWGWLFALGGGYLLWRQYEALRAPENTGRQTTQRWDSDSRYDDSVLYPDDERSTEEPHLVDDAPSGTQIYAHALDAVRRAGMDPASTPVLPVDMGVMSFKANEPPALNRTRPVLDDVDYVQPFVQLRLATRATGKIRFEIVDADGQVVFVHEDFHNLQAGMNLVSPPARLPIHDAHAMHRDWTLRISADNITIAEHRFAWEESSEKVIRRHVQQDGELSNEMRQMLDDSRMERMSLDELLQEQEQPAARSGRR
jgi:hypothetical protein